MKGLKAKRIWKILIKLVKDRWEWGVGIAVMLGFLVYFASQAQSWKEFSKSFQVLNQKRRNDHKNAIDKRAEEIEKRKEVIDRVANAMDEIDRKYEKKRKEERDKMKKDVEKIANDFEDDPEGFAKEIADKYDLEYVEE